jgi:hypothetical protein
LTVIRTGSLSSSAAEAGVVDEDVDAQPEPVGGLVYRLRGAVGGQVLCDHFGADCVFVVEAMCERGQRVGRAGDEHEVAAAGRQRLGECLPIPDEAPVTRAVLSR